MDSRILSVRVCSFCKLLHTGVSVYNLIRRTFCRVSRKFRVAADSDIFNACRVISGVSIVRRTSVYNLIRRTFCRVSHKFRVAADTDIFNACWVIFGVSVVRRTRTWTTGSLTCVFDIFACVYICNGVEWSKDRTQAAESIKWRPQQAYGSNQVLLSQPQTIFSTPKILTLTHR